MITVKAPCPYCGKPVKVERFRNTFVIGCVGETHCVQIYRGHSPEQLAADWDASFLVNEVPIQ